MRGIGQKIDNVPHASPLEFRSLRGRIVQTDRQIAHYYRGGAGAPLLLLHGWPETWIAFANVIPFFIQKFDTVAPDLRGFGLCRGSNEPITRETNAELIADDLIDLLNVLSIDGPVDVLSYDVGSNVAQELARRAPDRVRKLAFFACTYIGIGARLFSTDHVGNFWYYLFHQNKAAEDIFASDRKQCMIYLENLIHDWMAPGNRYDPDMIESYADYLCIPGGATSSLAWYRGVFKLRQRMMKEGAFELEKIPHPSYFLWPELDPLLPPAFADNLSEYFLNAYVEMLSNVGHFPHVETPAIVCRRIMSFF